MHIGVMKTRRTALVTWVSGSCTLRNGTRMLRQEAKGHYFRSVAVRADGTIGFGEWVRYETLSRSIQEAGNG